MSALDTLDTFFVIAFSKLVHGMLSFSIPMSTQNADTASSVVCEAPESESAPKKRMVNVSITTSSTTGMNESMAEGRFFKCCVAVPCELSIVFILINLCINIHNTEM